MMKKNSMKIIIAVASVFFLASCGIYTKYSKPNLEIENLAGSTMSLPDSAAVPVPSIDDFFTDAMLKSLIDKALEANSDLKIAELNISQAERILTTSRLAFLPSLTLAPNASAGRVGGTSSQINYSIPLQANWELDIFGKLRNSKEQAKSALYQSQDYAQMIRTQLVSGVASAYYSLVLLDTQLKISKESEKIAAQTLESMIALKEVGLQTEAAVLSASASLKGIQLSIKDIEKSVNDAESGLCLLLNMPPQKIERSEILSLDSDLEKSISLAVLSNRPDVRAAEMSLSQSFYGVNYARSALYPSISLTGSAGWANNTGGVILNPSDFVFSILGSLTQPLFMAGANKANLDIAKYQYEQQLISFEKALLIAGKEVNDALVEREVAMEKSVISSNQVDELYKAVEVTKLLMENGKANYLEVLNAQNYYLNSQINEVINIYNYSIGGINLYKAIGGGAKRDVN